MTAPSASCSLRPRRLYDDPRADHRVYALFDVQAGQHFIPQDAEKDEIGSFIAIDRWFFAVSRALRRVILPD